MPDYSKILDDIASGALSTSGINSAAASNLDIPELLSWQRGQARAKWQVNADYLNSRGALFGGYYGVLADMVLAFAAMTVLEDNEHYTTQDLKLSFFKPVFTGTVYLTAEVVTRTRSRVYCECRFLDEHQAVLAVATAAQHVNLIEQSD